MLKTFILYSSEGCHLCEQALALCLPLLTQSQLRVVDIVEDANLVELYGMHIPVLACLGDENINNEMLFWPFSSEDIAKLADK